MITSATFVKSAQSKQDSLNEDKSEIVFLGRSNVGKSSTINAFTNKKGLAKSSSTPGKTRLINFFDIDYSDKENTYSLRLVDLPGFGYAKVSKSLKEEWQKNLVDFIKERVSIRLFVHLKDARHPHMEIDKEVEEFIVSIIKPDQKYITLFTKIDKLNQKERYALQRDFPSTITFTNLKPHTLEPLHKEVLKTIFGVKL
ncbi:MAG: YihA family ribosome biogenesis GTP-binding protein [Campylobacterales bacterium]|nr:YihA family ribosome biogenesis GTP-binding protein [Campylobacterales bacterium]